METESEGAAVSTVLLQRQMKAAYARIPHQSQVVYDWQSVAGIDFWDQANKAVCSGQVSIETIGWWTGISNINNRYANWKKRP